MPFFLSSEIKSDESFKQNIADLASGDCRHDFGINIATKGLLNQFNSSLPKEVSSSPTEDECLNIVAGRDFRLFLDSVNETADSPLQISVKSTSQKEVANYQVRKFAANNYNDSNFAKKFYEITEFDIGTKNVAIIVDFNQHGFLSKLKTGASVDCTVHYIMTPEEVNDPAGKPSINDKSLFDASQSGIGLTLKSYLQIDSSPTDYSPYKPDNLSTNNNFFSKYNLAISPIQQNFTKGNTKNLSLNTSLIISHDINGKLCVNTINDSKKQNSINSLMSFVGNLMSRITKKTTPTDIFNFNSKLQQKRGGDWLQALCCLSLGDKSFKQYLPSLKDVEPIFFKNMPVYLITHDRIALAYALSNGVNVIYLSNNKDTFVFKNYSDPNITSNLSPIEERLKNDLIRFTSPVGNNPPPFKSFEIDSQNYISFRKELVGLCKDNFDKAVQDEISNPNITKLKNMEMKNLDYINEYKGKFKNLLTSIQNVYEKACLLCYILENLPDIEEKFNTFTGFINSFTNNSNIGEKNVLIEMNNIRNFIQNNAIDKLGSISRDLVEVTAINTHSYFDKMLKKTDIIKTIEYLFFNANYSEGVSEISEFTSRIYNWSSSNSEPQPNDQFIFLQFIKKLSVNANDTSNLFIQEIITKIIECIENFKVCVIKYGESLQSVYLQEGTRQRKIPPDQINYFFRPANLIYETLIVLSSEIKPFPPFTVEIDSNEKPVEVNVLNESTDDVLVKTDMEEIIINETTNKISNSVDEETPSSKLEGGGLNILSSGTTIGKPFIVYDSTINQMIWPLFTSVINNQYYFSTLKNYEIFNKVSNASFPDPLKEQIKTVLNYSADISNFTNKDEINSFVDGLPDEYKGIIYQLALLHATTSGGEDPEVLGQNGDEAKKLLNDTTICFHPLLPIYILCTSFYRQLGPDFNDEPFFDTYTTYIKILDKISQVLISNYLSSNDSSDILNGYLLGYSLKVLFFTANKNIELFKTLQTNLGISQQDCIMFGMKNDIFAGPVIGDNIVDDNTLQFVIEHELITSELFLNFINRDVNLKQLIEAQETISVASSEDAYKNLKSQVKQLLDSVASRIILDRTGTVFDSNLQMINLGSLETASGITEFVPQENIENDAKTNVPSIETTSEMSGIPGISSEERKRKAEEGETKYQENVARGMQEKRPRLVPFDPSRKRGSEIFKYSDDGDNIEMATSSVSRKRKISRGGKKNKTIKKNSKTRKNKSYKIVKKERKIKNTRRNKRNKKK